MFPRDANFANPSFRFLAWSRIATPRAPLWERKEMCPRRGVVGANVASIWTSGWVLITPMQFGPTRTIPYRFTSSTRRFSRSAPTPPISRNPAVITTRPRTPFFPHASTASRAASAGTVTIARSTGSGTSPMLGYALIPWTESAFGFTGYRVPWNSFTRRFRRIAYPTFPLWREAPITAMDLGKKIGSTRSAIAGPPAEATINHASRGPSPSKKQSTCLLLRAEPVFSASENSQHVY